MTLLEQFYPIAGAALMFFGLFIIASNYRRQIVNLRNRKNPEAGWSSPAPFVGPLLVILGFSFLPVPFSMWIFLVIALDPDTVLTILSLPSFFRGLGGRAGA